MKKKMIKLPNLEKAQDHAMWLNFKHRQKGKTFGVLQSIEGDFIVTDVYHPTFKDEEFEALPMDYSNISFKHIRHIGIDEDPLTHFEEIKGMFSIMHGEHLRFVLAYNLPLEKFIRYELASRGHDENHVWVGFKKAEAIWLK